MATKKDLIVEGLDKDELEMIMYVLNTNDGTHGDPLKDTYELGDDEPVQPYRALTSGVDKMRRAAMAWKEAK